jgi:hypothetical protein
MIFLKYLVHFVVDSRYFHRFEKFVYRELNDMSDAENMIFLMISFDVDIS